MTLHDHHTFKGILFSIAGFSLWSCGDAAYKYLSEFYGMGLLIFANAALVTAALLVMSPWLGGLKQTFQTKKLKLHFFRGFLIFLQVAGVVYGFSHMSMTKTYSIVFIAPLFATLLSIPLLKEKVHLQQWLAIAIGFVGILVILRPGVIPLEPAVAAVIFSALCFSLSNILIRKIGHEGETLLAWGLIPQIVMLACSAVLYAMNFELFQLVHLPLFIFLGAMSSGGIICIALAFIYAPPAIAAPFHYVQMLWAVLFGFTLFGDVPDLWTGAGAVTIVTSGLWLIKAKRP